MALKDIEAALQGYRQLTDAYILALASRRKGVLATCDRGLRTLAGCAAARSASDRLRNAGVLRGLRRVAVVSASTARSGRRRTMEQI